MAGLNKGDLVATNIVNNAVLRGNSSRPASAQVAPQWLRLTDAFEWVAHYGFDEFHDPQSNSPVFIDPVF